MTLKKLAYTLLLIIAFWMLYLGHQGGILPPVLTGLGFIIIAITGMKESK